MLLYVKLNHQTVKKLIKLTLLQPATGLKMPDIMIYNITILAPIWLLDSEWTLSAHFLDYIFYLSKILNAGLNNSSITATSLFSYPPQTPTKLLILQKLCGIFLLAPFIHVFIYICLYEFCEHAVLYMWGLIALYWIQILPFFFNTEFRSIDDMKQLMNV